MNAPGDLWEITWHQRLHGQSLNLVRHYSVQAVSGVAGASGTVQTAAAVATAMGPISDILRQITSSELSLEHVKVQRVRPGPRTLGLLSGLNQGPGLDVGNSLPSTVCAVIRYQTEFAGRRYRGRSFIGGLDVASETNSRLAGPAITDIGTLGTAILATRSVLFTAGSGEMVLVPVLWHKDDNTVTPLYTMIVDPILRVQRRREVGKGV